LIDVARYTLAIQVVAELRALSRATLEEAESVASSIIGSCFKYKEFDFRVIEASACGNDNSCISSSASISVVAERIGLTDIPCTALVNMLIDE
jgi:predicted signal transduction protein with EAL and GGDEF domain